MKILVLCTGNSFRSQMAEGILHSLDPTLVVVSAGTCPEKEINPIAVKVMQEIGMDISHQRPKSVDRYLDEPFDYVITVCDHARESCPAFTGRVGWQIHLGFEDPASVKGSPEYIMKFYRDIRNQILDSFTKVYQTLGNK